MNRPKRADCREYWIKLKRCVRWLIHGKTVEEMGLMEGLSPRQARTKLDVVKSSLGTFCLVATVQALNAFDAVYDNPQEREHHKTLILEQQKLHF